MMLNLEELTQLIAFSDHGTLTKAAEAMNISQPTFTRTMKSLEEQFGVSLFNRGKNRIELNETGLLAVERARMILKEADDAIRAVRNFDQSRNIIRVLSCAPAPLWVYLPSLSQKNPSKTISSGLAEIETIIREVAEGGCEIGIIPYAVELDGLDCKELIEENLSIVLAPGHPLLQGNPKSLSLADLNGHNCLLRSKIGFWDALCRRKMPASRFLVQEDDYEFFELIRNSSLPFFITNLVDTSEYIHGDRIIVPITDSEANVIYHLLRKRQLKGVNAQEEEPEERKNAK